MIQNSQNSTMNSNNDGEIAIDFSPYFVIYKDGSIKRFLPPQFAPTRDDPNAAVKSKDVVIDSSTGVSVRFYLPTKSAGAGEKLPLLFYVHGGAFCLGSATSPPFDSFASSVVERSNFMAVSVDYRLAPEDPIPICYDDSWMAFKWVLSHSTGKGPDSWLNEHADFNRVFLAGESAGANIVHDVAIRAGDTDLHEVKVRGLVLFHAFFGGKDVDKLYKLLCPASSGRDDDPRLNPAIDPRLKAMPCKKVLFFVAELDFLRKNAVAYYEKLKKSDWEGETEIFETEGEGHCFYIFNPKSEKALSLMNRLVLFLTHEFKTKL